MGKKNISKHIEVYGNGCIKPKTHWIWDVFFQLRRQGDLLDAFIIERLHLRAKALADSRARFNGLSNASIAALVNLELKGSALLPGVGETQLANGRDDLLPGQCAYPARDFVVPSGGVLEHFFGQ